MVCIEETFKGLTGNRNEMTNQTKNWRSSNNRQRRLFYLKVLRLFVKIHLTNGQKAERHLADMVIYVEKDLRKLSDKVLLTKSHVTIFKDVDS
jgi:hypothetical protein